MDPLGRKKMSSPQPTHRQYMTKWIVWEGKIAAPGQPVPDPRRPLEVQFVLDAAARWRIQAGIGVFGPLQMGLVGSVMGESVPDGDWLRVKLLLNRALVEELGGRLAAEKLWPCIEVTADRDEQRWQPLGDGRRTKLFTGGTITRIGLTPEPTWPEVDPVWEAPPPREYLAPAPPVVFADDRTRAGWRLVPAGPLGQLAAMQLPVNEFGKLVGRIVENAHELQPEGVCRVGDPNCPEPGGHDHDGCEAPDDGQPLNVTAADIAVVQDALGEMDEALCRVLDRLRRAKVDAQQIARQQ